MYDHPPDFVKIPPFRFVKPYQHIYRTNVKSRWLNMTLIDAMAQEFRAYTREYYENAIIEGKITINGDKVNPLYKLQHGMQIEHTTTRVEPPILDLPIDIVYEDQEFVVVSKPPSMIVHTGGGYHYNCLTAILHFEHNLKDLYVLHRLDRLTSGLLLFSKNKQLAQQFHDANSKLTVQKTYLARVQGNFSDQIQQNSKPQYCVSMKDAIFACCSEEDAEKLQAKQATTKFQKLWYDEKSDSTLLECKPITGRTHQIRVHLADLGHPILNDIGYGGKFVGNEVINRNFKDLKQQPIRQKEVLDGEVEEVIQKKVKLQDGEVVKKVVLHQEQYGNENLLKDCLAGKEEWDYLKHPLEIYLHSWKYQFNDKEFVSKEPYWYYK